MLTDHMLNSLSTRSIANTTSTVPVVCAFPLSSNYGPGSRILYYVLVISCVCFRRAEWLRNACLAAAMVLPAISSLHSLVLSISHVNGAVDMDIYGAFQFCAIGILAAPLTVRLSRTYFYDPGRNLVFLWTVLVLMGLVALCVEFYRVTPVNCSQDDFGNPLPQSASKFPYGNAKCNMICSEDDGPFSPMRGGSAANIYIIPAPRILSFNTSMLLAAGFCVPAVLSLIFTWDKILEINWKRRQPNEQLDAQIEGANMTVRELKGINNVVRQFLSVIEIPLFGGVILTLIGVGEANFFSPQIIYETEPMASIGQWSPLAGTLLAAFGSLYLLWAANGETDDKKKSVPRDNNSTSSRQSRSSERRTSRGQLSAIDYTMNRNLEDNALRIRSPSPNDFGLTLTITHPDHGNKYHESDVDDTHDQPTAGRHRVRKFLTSAGNKLGNAAHNKLDASDYSDENAHRFPEVPGESLRNPALAETSRTYSRLREERASSMYTASIASISAIESNSTPPPTHDSPRPDASPTRLPKRRDTLEVPKPVHSHHRSESQ